MTSKSERAERLAAQLRANLKRRKQQARGRTQSAPSGDGCGAPDADQAGAADTPGSETNDSSSQDSAGSPPRGAQNS